MIEDMTKVFKEKMKDNIEYEKMILENYKLKDGLYIRLRVDQEPEIIEENHIIVNNKRSTSTEGEIKKPELYKWFKAMDYYSVILNDDTNKAIDLPAKKIHSTNWMTLFIKKDIFPEVGKEPLEKEKLLTLIDNFYEKLKNSEEKLLELFLNSEYINKKPGKKEKEEFLQKFFKVETAYIRSEERTRDLEVHKNYIMNKFDKIAEVIKNFAEKNNFNGYIKIFFDISTDIYKLESSIYTIPRLFNVNNFNLFTENSIVGLPSNNITTNIKKPYLLLKSMQCNVPFRSAIDEVKASKNFFEWLVMQGKFKEVKFDHNYKFDGTEKHKKNEAYFSVQLDKNAEIVDFDFVPFDLPKLDFTLENVLRLTEKRSRDEESNERYFVGNLPIDDYKMLQEKFSEYFFNNRFLSYYKGTDPDIKTNEFTGQMKSMYMLSREALFNYFSKGINTSFRNILNKLTMALIIEQLRHTAQGSNLYRTAKAFNLRISLLKYFEGEKYTMADKIMSNIENLQKKLSSEDFVTCSSDEEFYFTAGQLAYYILSQSEADKKNFGLFEPILNVKNSSQLKKRLKEVFAVYKHAISIGNIKFKNAMSMVMGYDSEEQINDKMQEMLLAGIMANNIFYVSNK